MDFCTPRSNRRHNPVDSICRKLQTIRRRGDLEPNSPFQIPKLSSSSYDGPRRGLRNNLEDVLKKGAVHRDEGAKWGDETARGEGKRMGMPGSAERGSLGPYTRFNPSAPASVTSSTLGERTGADLRRGKTWQRCCSTPARESPYFSLTRGPQPVQPEGQRPSGSPRLHHAFAPIQETQSYDLNFSSAIAGGSENDPCPPLVVKRLSMGGGGSSMASENGKENMSEISLICEENLLDTIFYACDTRRRGKVFVSHIVDYVRHTTSRGSEDSGLEELCNMLDPEHKDVSIDLDTYHAVMREWIDDCRNNWEETTDDATRDSVTRKDSLSVKRSILLNLTSGSLEAFGGEVSRVEFDTSELVNCVAELQMNDQKLQEEVRKLKQVVEGMEDGNQKLADENEELRNQARINQQLAQKDKMLKEEVEEMKATLSCTEQGRARASAHGKHVERENQNLISKIASLQEENFKLTMEMDDLQRRVTELCDINTDLHVQIHSFDGIIGEKEDVVREKSKQINELKSAVEEYSAVTELLRADKSKLETQMMMMMHPDLTGSGASLSVAYRLNQDSSGSLQTELALAQSPLEAQHGVDYLFTTMSVASTLDETLDREVLLLLQGPSPEYMAEEFRNRLNKLKKDFSEETRSVLSTVRGLLDDRAQPQCNTDASIQTVQAELDARRADWALGLDQLARYTDSLEKELIKMASNMRRSRTEILHLSVRVQEQQKQKQQLCEELEQLKAPQDGREASCQTPASEEELRDDSDWNEEFAFQDFLQHELAERNCRDQGGPTECRLDVTDGGEDGEEKWVVVDTTGWGEVRNTSDLWATLSEEVRSGYGTAGGSTVCTTSGPDEVNCQPLQEEAAVPSQLKDVGISLPEEDALPALSHIGNNKGAKSFSCNSTQNLSRPSQQDQTITLSSTPLKTAEMVPPDCKSPGPDEAVSKSERTLLNGHLSRSHPSLFLFLHFYPSQSLSHNQSAASSAADSTFLLPVLVEEEESVSDSVAEARAAATSTEGMEQLTGSSAATNSPSQPPVAHGSQSQSGVGSVSSDSGHSEDSSPTKDSLPLCGKNKKKLELSSSMEVTEEQKVQEDQNENSMPSEKDAETSLISDNSNSLSPSDKEVEAEFQRLALGFKCDMFTLERRLRLEERSRDLAEENVRREVSSCQGLLQALTPLCEDDNQSMEIIQRLQKNLDILLQSMMRVSSRSEMLGAIHQENRIGKAVEVMIQHVENLKRMYTKEHAELLELREALMQNERSFGSQTERDDFRGKKQPTSQYYKSARRVSIAAIPRSGGGNTHLDLSKTQEGSEVEMERLVRRSPWNMAGNSMARPPLKRYISSAAWLETEEPSVMMKGMFYNSTDCHSEDKQKEETVVHRRRSSLSELGNKLTSFILPLKTTRDELFVMLPSPSSGLTSPDPGIAATLSHNTTATRAAAAENRGGRGLWLWLAMVVVLAGLLALLASLMMQPVVDAAAPVGTGDSWMTVQQLLWPYAGVRHHGQPPV
ncbi:inositol 1,4,5-triphosphate receptor associated 2 [Brachionichthys hirsutus]|uniref:inositol 1,4,5-triphosphate receptor associated 2 n=1 Tax=Brachionichthys hirsutus TaxID=412623 RepID=UPI0036049432